MVANYQELERSMIKLRIKTALLSHKLKPAGFRFFNFLPVHQLWPELAINKHLCLVAVKLAEYISRLAGWINAHRTFDIGHIDQNPHLRSVFNRVETLIILLKRLLIHAFVGSANGKRT